MGRGDRISIIQAKKVSYEGYIEANEVYKNMMHFLEEELHYDPAEREHEEKDIDGSRKIITKIDASAPYNDYYALNIRFFLDISGKETEIEDNGKKRLVLKGTAVLTINAFVLPDYKEMRDKGPLGEFVGKLYDRFLAKEELDKAITKVAVDTGKFVSFFRKEVNSKLV